MAKYRVVDSQGEARVVDAEFMETHESGLIVFTKESKNDKDDVIVAVFFRPASVIFMRP